MEKLCNSDFDAAIQSAIKVVGLKKLKDEQKRAIHAFVEGQDVFLYCFWKQRQAVIAVEMLLFSLL